MMKFLAWSCVVVWASAACGCNSGSDSPDPPNPASDPIGFTFETADGSFSSIGWTGVFHNIKGSRDAAFGANVTACDHGVCQFEGPSDPVSKVDRQRCLYGMNQTCTTDSDCLVNGANLAPCVYIYDAPISTPLKGGDGKIGACAFTYIPVSSADGKPTIQGTLNQVSGELNIDKLTVLLALNAATAGTFQGVCPVCVNDTSPNDGIKGGTCQTSPVPDPTTGRADPGLNSGGKCDVNRYGDLRGYNFGYSMDCAPKLTSGIGQPTQFGGSFSSSGFQIALTDQSPKCTDPASQGQGCFCGMCQDGVTACSSSSDCSDGKDCVGASIPANQTSTMNIPVAANACDGGVCNWDPTSGTGTCTTSRFGTPAIPVGCYPSLPNASNGIVSITAPGRAAVDHGIYYADTASARCTPAGLSPAVNFQVGLPGLTFQKRNFRIIPAFAEGPK